MIALTNDTTNVCLTAWMLLDKIILFFEGPVAQLGARINRTDEVAGSNPARSTLLTIQRFEGKIPAVETNGGPWRSWERVSMALRRSWVRIPLGPPKNIRCENRIIENNP